MEMSSAIQNQILDEWNDEGKKEREGDSVRERERERKEAGGTRQMNKGIYVRNKQCHQAVHSITRMKSMCIRLGFTIL